MGEPTHLSKAPIADVRRRLNELRGMWKMHSVDNPFFCNARLNDGTVVIDFAFAFVTSHHKRRGA